MHCQNIVKRYHVKYFVINYYVRISKVPVFFYFPLIILIYFPIKKSPKLCRIKGLFIVRLVLNYKIIIQILSKQKEK